jgi:endonuclease/exonuclease/phosphatase family metal-dependent hydrolase
MRSSSPTLNVPTSLAIRILTHNIRYATTSPFPGELPWADRKAGLVSELLYHTRHCPAAIICLQEVLHEQLVDVLTGLNGTRSEWSYVGVGRDDGRQAGEFAPIIYRSQVLHLERYYTMWLSPTPWVPGSKGWDAASVRILTVAKLRHRESGAIVWAMNTHLDDQGAVSRREGAKMIVRTAKEVMVEGDVDIAFLAGDLNSETSGEAYRVLNEEGSGLVDLERLVKRGYGDEMTFTGYVCGFSVRVVFVC